MEKLAIFFKVIPNKNQVRIRSNSFQSVEFILEYLNENPIYGSKYNDLKDLQRAFNQYRKNEGEKSLEEKKI